MGSMIRKLYSMELEEQERSNCQDEKLLSEVRKLLEKNKASIQVENKTGREGVDLAFTGSFGRCISETALYEDMKKNGGNSTAIRV